MEKIPTAGEQKIEEYVNRIKNGESKDSIIEGLPNSFIKGIEEGLKSTTLDNAEIYKQNKIKDETEIERLRKELGITLENPEKKSIEDLVEFVTQGRSQVVLDLYKKFLTEIDNSESRHNLIHALFNDVYKKYRSADYPHDPDEENTWEESLISSHIGVNNKKTEWMYRGVFPQREEQTLTRASLNVQVTPELINALDTLIMNGKIKANYKFGQPGTSASPNERHDAISIYFLEQPSDEVLQEISNIIKPYARGDMLLGKKISDGFFMSEIGSIESSDIDLFVSEMKIKDSVFADVIKKYTSPSPGRGASLKMSEAQFYAIKDVAQAFGYTISYNKYTGFEIK